MKFGLPLRGLSPRHYPEVGRTAEEYGFESVWLPEHLVLPATLPATYPYSPGGIAPLTPDTALYDPWVVLAGVAAVTTTIRLAASVYILPLRHPISTARSVMSLDRLSGGRVTLGIGIGWLEEEFTALGESFQDRAPRTDEALSVIRRLWTEKTIEHHGRYFDFGPVCFEPKPVQKPSIPVEIGGISEPALRRAGWCGDGWIEIGLSRVEELQQALEVIWRTREEAGRSHLSFEVTSGLAQDPAGIRHCADLGVTRLIAKGPSPKANRIDKGTVLDWVRRFGDEVIAKV